MIEFLLIPASYLATEGRVHHPNHCLHLLNCLWFHPSLARRDVGEFRKLVRVVDGRMYHHPDFVGLLIVEQLFALDPLDGTFQNNVDLAQG